MNISNFSSEALKEELQRREVHTGDSDDDSLYSDPRAVTSQSKKRHRSASPDLLDDDANARPARRNATDVTSRNETHIEGMKARRTKLVVTQEEKDFDLASKLQADEAASSLNSQKQLTQKQLTDPRFGTKSRPIDVDRMRSPFQGRTTATKDFDPQDAAIVRQLHREELQAQEERLRKAASRTRDCAVCGEATLIIELPSLSSCPHDAQTCRDCYATWIASQLENNGWQQVKCPGTTCKINLEHEEIKAYATKAVFERYDALQTCGVLSSDPKFCWCRAQGCTSGQIHDAREVGNLFTCIHCRASFCIVHGSAHDASESCREYEDRTREEEERNEREKEIKASEDALGKLSKRCPNKNCNSPIQKNGWCNHITCKSASST